MKIRYLNFLFVILLSITFIFVLPALSQSASFRAKVIRVEMINDGKNDSGINISGTSAQQLADRVSSVIRPKDKFIRPEPNIKLLLGNIQLSSLRKSLLSKGINAQYFKPERGILGADKFDTRWNPIETASIRPSSDFLGMSFSKNDYLSSEILKFRVKGVQGNDLLLVFENPFIILEGEDKNIYYTISVQSGNSGIRPDWLYKQLNSKDKRIRRFYQDTFDLNEHIKCLEKKREVRGQNPGQNPGTDFFTCGAPHYLIKLSRG